MDASRDHIGSFWRFDAVTLLTAYVVLLLSVPAPMVVGPLGTAGSPATILGITTFCLWLWFHIHRNYTVNTGRQPVRAAMIAWFIVILIAYAHAMSRPIPSDEISPADSGVLRLVAMSGIVLMANDGIASWERYRVLVRRLVIGVGLVAILGIVQTATKELWVDRISIPGLTSGAAGWTLAARSGLVRPSGTATHPIEYGMVLTTVLPLAITLARSAPRGRWLYRLFLVAIAISTLLAISRSAMICGAVSIVVLIASWPWMSRLRALVFVVGIATLVFLTVPGVLGTITNLFTGIDNDASIQSRTGSYDVAGMFIERSPLLGRGFGTFLPKYWILDNGYLGQLIEAGILGITALLILIIVAAHAARLAARAADLELDRELATSLIAAIIAGGVGLAFFDTFGFPQSAGVFFLLIGMAGAASRLSTADKRIERSATIPDDRRQGVDR